jgi:flagellar basal-body rod protein FlgG
MPQGIQVGHGVRNSATTLIFAQGTYEATGRSLDLVIQDQNSLFKIQMPNGDITYTRDGSFHRDSAGNIVTSAGYKLFPGFVVPQDAVDVSIASNGRVEAVFGTGPNQDLGTIELATFNNPGGLRLLGGNLYGATSSSGTEIAGTPGDGQFGELQSGYLEASNVSAAEELINLIKAQRAFEMNSRSITTSDEMLQTVATLKR